jgi:hypothetical protein
MASVKKRERESLLGMHANNVHTHTHTRYLLPSRGFQEGMVEGMVLADSRGSSPAWEGMVWAWPSG